MMGLRSVDAPARAAGAATSPGHPEGGKPSFVEVNPLATWTGDGVDDRLDAKGLARRPLLVKGDCSIGCAPATLVTAPREHPGAGAGKGARRRRAGAMREPRHPETDGADA